MKNKVWYQLLVHDCVLLNLRVLWKHRIWLIAILDLLYFKCWYVTDKYDHYTLGEAELVATSVYVSVKNNDIYALLHANKIDTVL